MSRVLMFIFIFIVIACESPKPKIDYSIDSKSKSEIPKSHATALILLGTIQDAGSPQIGCSKDCCRGLFENPDKNRQVIALGLYDKLTNKKYLFDATPDMPQQINALKNFGQKSDRDIPDGIFLTHAHIGHYTGLMYLGKEAMGAYNIPVYAMPRMKKYLETNGPWSQLVANKNILIQSIYNEETISLSKDIKVTPIRVPHRDEYSETVAYLIEGPKKKALFIPDIDKWNKWDRNIIDEIKKVDYAFLDATFYSGHELNNRDMSLIPHPFVIESMKKFNAMANKEKQKVIFIHFNHTNPIIDLNSKEGKTVIQNGFRIGRINDSFEL